MDGFGSPFSQKVAHTYSYSTVSLIVPAANCLWDDLENLASLSAMANAPMRMCLCTWENFPRKRLSLIPIECVHLSTARSHAIWAAMQLAMRLFLLSSDDLEVTVNLWGAKGFDCIVGEFFVAPIIIMGENVWQVVSLSFKPLAVAFDSQWQE